MTEKPNSCQYLACEKGKNGIVVRKSSCCSISGLTCKPLSQYCQKDEFMQLPTEKLRQQKRTDLINIINNRAQFFS